MNKDIVTVEQPKECEYFAKDEIVWFEGNDGENPVIRIDYVNQIRVMDMNDE